MLSWLDTLPAAFTAAHKSELVALFDWLVPPLLRVAMKEVGSVLPMQEINLVVSCMQLFESLLGEWCDTPKVRTQPASSRRSCPPE